MQIRSSRCYQWLSLDRVFRLRSETFPTLSNEQVIAKDRLLDRFDVEVEEEEAVSCDEHCLQVHGRCHHEEEEAVVSKKPLLQGNKQSVWLRVVDVRLVAERWTLMRTSHLGEKRDSIKLEEGNKTNNNNTSTC